jgi:hypothetical protein
MHGDPAAPAMLAPVARRRRPAGFTTGYSNQPAVRSIV